MVDDLTIRCKYSTNGCDLIMKVGDLKAHSEQCQFYPVACPNAGCDFVAARHLIKDHTPLLCEFKTEICQKGCQKVLKQSEMQSHNCIASVTAEVKMLRANDLIMREDVNKQGDHIKELQT